MKLLSKDYLQKHLPPNIDAENAHTLIHGMLIACAALGFIIFLCKYGNYYNDLFYYRDGRKLLKSGMMMVAFPQLMKGICFVSAWEIWMVLGYSVKLYASFFGKSQSIYLMRRLPDNRKTLRRMIIDVPLAWALSVLVWTLVSVGVAYLIWRFYTPAVCLPL